MPPLTHLKRCLAPGPLVVAAASALMLAGRSSPAAEHGLPGNTPAPRVAAASDDGEMALRKFRVPKGWKVDLIAAEPDLANPVAFAFDESERIYVVETFRTVEDRIKLLRYYFAENAPQLEQATERVKLLQRGADGRVTGSTVFADGFNTIEDGLASGVLARRGEVWFADIPHLWRLRDRNGDGVSDERTSLSRGYGVRIGFLGHDLHGLRFGPDGRLYFTVGDRGADVTTREGRHLQTPDSGAVFRCDPDGSNLETPTQRRGGHRVRDRDAGTAQREGIGGNRAG